MKMNLSRRVLVQGMAFLFIGFVLRLKAQNVANRTCINGVEFLLTRQELEFFESRAFCGTLGMSLARISSDAEFNAVVNLRQRLNLNKNFWIGKSKLLLS